MKKRPASKEILENNPEINIRLLGESFELSKELRKRGVEKKDYDLALRGSRFSESAAFVDHRTIHLSRYYE